MNTFDSEAAISRWRDQLAAGDAISIDALEELESHLRECMCDLQEQSRLSQEEAFLIARRRLGSTDSLDREFSQVTAREVWKRRLFWMLLGFIDLTATLAVISMLGYLGTWGAVAFGAPESVWLWSMLSYAGAALLLAAIGFVLWKYVLIGNPFIVAEHFGRYPVFCSVAILVVLALLKLGSVAVDVVVSRTVSVESFGLVAMHANYASIALFAVVFVAACIALAVLAKSLRPAAEA